MIRYYDKILKCEVFEAGDNTIASDEGIIDWWFKPLEDGYAVEYGSDGIPKKVSLPPPLPIDPNEDKKDEIRNEMNALVGDMTMPEAMYLMLQYGMQKMSLAATPNDQSDTPAPPPASLTPTGEDLLTWGDRIASELEQKIMELRSL